MMDALFNQTFSIGQSYPDPASLRSYSPPPPSFPGEGEICIEHKSLVVHVHVCTIIYIGITHVHVYVHVYVMFTCKHCGDFLADV